MEDYAFIEVIGIILAIIAVIVSLIIGVKQIRLALIQNKLTSQQIENTKVAAVEVAKVHEAENTRIAAYEYSESDYRKRPYPSEIVDEINRLPPYQRISASSNYVGIRVGWKVCFHALINYRDTQNTEVAHLMLSDRGTYPWIYCDVALAKYPELRIITRNQKMWVYGSISKVDGHDIWLEDCFLKIS